MATQDGRNFLRANGSLIRSARKQSRAFVQAEDLSALALQFNSKSHAPSGAEHFPHWDDGDVVPQNFAAKFPPRSQTVAVVDLDIDVRPLGDWTEELVEEARNIVSGIMSTIVKIGDLD